MTTRREFLGMLSVASLSGCAGLDGVNGAATGIDTHAHVFRRGLKLADVRRYAPNYDATAADYLAVLDANGMSHGVLVQPSFLGTDNSYMVESLQRHPGRLRGIAVVAPEASETELDALAAAGVVGVRLNLVGLALPDFSAGPWPHLLKSIARRRWQVEIHREARDLPQIIAPLLEHGVIVVVDHFGRPDPRLGVDDPGFRYLLSTGKTGQVWVKVSAAYRNGASGAGEATAMRAAPMLRDAFGAGRLVWGSDWPHTQFEAAVRYASLRAQLEQWFPDETERRNILVANARQLFRFQMT